MIDSLFFDELKTPIGKICLLTTKDKLFNVYLKGKPKNLTFSKKETNASLLAKKQLELYFKGKIKKFSLKTEIYASSFQKKILDNLYKVPYGTTLSYKDLAIQSGLEEKYARAVGAVMRSNPIPIVYPCHRIIGSNSNLTGFGGGLEMKTKLLELEKTNLETNLKN